MANFFDRIKQAYNVLAGNDDVEQLKKDLSTSQQETTAVREELQTTQEKMKKQARLHIDQLDKRDTAIQNQDSKLKSMAREPLTTEDSVKYPTADLFDMVEKVLRYKPHGRNGEKQPKPVLVPDEVDKLIFQEQAYLDARRTHENKDVSLMMALAEVCFKNADESWAKPVLKSLFQAVSQKDQESIILSISDHYWAYNLDSVKLLDFAISQIPPEKFDLEPFIADRNGAKENGYVGVYALLRKHGIFTENNPSFKKIIDSIPFYIAPPDNKDAIKARPWAVNLNYGARRYDAKFAKDEKGHTMIGHYIPRLLSIMAYESGKEAYRSWLEQHQVGKDGDRPFDLDQRLESYRERTQLAHDKIMEAKTPRERVNAEARFGKDFKINCEIYQILTGKPLWPDLQKPNNGPAPAKGKDPR